MAETIITVVLLALLIWGAIALLEHRVIYEYENGLLFERGRFVRLLEPGEYWVFKWRDRIDTVDARRNVLTVPGQEVLSKDGVTLKLSVLVEYRVSDPKTAIIDQADYLAGLYAMIQVALRELIGETDIEALLPAKNELGEQLSAAVAGRTESIGITIESLAIKDIMFPGPLKESFSQVARAKQEGLAALERARGEAAALRKLANAAKLMESNPELFRLRLLQSADSASSIVINLDQYDPVATRAGS